VLKNSFFKGSVIIFTGMLSVAFLDRVLKWREWSGIGAIISGLVVVGMSDFLSGAGNSAHHGRNDIITGDELIIMAQVITATQMVYEEKFINKHNIPAMQVYILHIPLDKFLMNFVLGCRLGRNIWVFCAWHAASSFLLH
jgi:drug/metabolite transporter (DMT)-like permease